MISDDVLDELEAAAVEVAVEVGDVWATVWSWLLGSWRPSVLYNPQLENVK